MSLEVIYDNICNNYSQQIDSYSMFSTVREQAIEQIIKHIPGQNKLAITDLGCGDGTFLEKIGEHYPNSHLFGLDLSDQILFLANQKNNLHTVKSDIENAHNHITKHSQDLISGQFVCGYVGMDALLQQANHALKEGGYLSLTTSTTDSFPMLYEQIGKFKHSFNPVKQLTHFIAWLGVKKVKTPANAQSIKNNLKNFKLIDQKDFEFDTPLNTPEEAVEFLIDGSWLIDAFNYPIIPYSFIKKLSLHLAKNLTYPMVAKHKVSVTLIKKQ